MGYFRFLIGLKRKVAPVGLSADDKGRTRGSVSTVLPTCNGVFYEFLFCTNILFVNF